MIKKHTQFQLVYFFISSCKDVFDCLNFEGLNFIGLVVFGIIRVVFIATGGLGVFSAKKPSRCTIQALMALTIISACLTVPRLVFDVLGAVSLDVTVKTEKLDDSLSKSLDAVSARYE